MFNRNKDSFNFPTGSGGSSGSDSETYQSGSDYDKFLFDAVGDFTAHIGAFEMALIGTVIIIVMTLILVSLVIGTLVHKNTTIF